MYENSTVRAGRHYPCRPLQTSRSRRGWGTRALAFTGAVGIALGLLLAHATHGSAALPGHTVVHPGQTLWSIASEHYPGDDPRARVEEIRSLNHLEGATISVGQSLELPPA